MAIKFDDALNNEIKRTVRNFNSKIKYNKYKTRGKGMLPQTIRVQDIKDKYSDKSRKELLKQLKLYQSFGERGTLESYKDSRITKWEAKYFKSNLAKTKKFYQDEIADLERIVGDAPEYHLKQHHRLNELKTKLSYLDKDLASLDESQVGFLRRAFGYAERSEFVKQKSFELYLNQIDRLLSLRGVPKSDRQALINKFNVLSENEFTEMVREEPIIDRIYDLVNSPEGRGEYELTVDDAEADGILEDLYNNLDAIISNYKSN